MIAVIVCGVFLFLAAFVLTVRMIMGDDSETRALKASLRTYGIEPRGFSNVCLTELIEIATPGLRLSKAPTDRAMGLAMHQVSHAVVAITYGDKFYSAAELATDAARERPDPYWIVLAKHDPARFALDRLEATQAANRRFLAARDAGESR